MQPPEKEEANSVADLATWSPIIDFRQYTLYPGTRDAFIELFDKELVETQEAAGMRVIGQFRDLGDPNRFVWIRGFPDMPSRKNALVSFYEHSATWKTFSDRARSMMIDSTDALLLRPAREGSGFTLPPPAARPLLESAIPAGLIVAMLFQLPAAADEALHDFFDRSVTPILVEAGASTLGSLVTEHSPNNFPRLALREGENVLATVLGFRDLTAYHTYLTALGRDGRWRTDAYPALVARINGRPQILRLGPTSRSQLRP
ncbi:NIPSNAP family protein [Bradyrhizobium sp. CW11]|uniref:NIPSNAP family protein n=1 Tax=Bradyrhizobium sp. CW11 TaxID=2782684 RepID=UPI001FF8F8B1|nr:NIPSNAP family protein [Bradyrhizobium sp. CW11]MCK1344502.1 NIPSNAP family protein [Bradyrhizobium sp. CW11]